LQDSPHKRFGKAFARINSDATTPRNAMTENSKQQQSCPSTKCEPGKPIVGNASTHIKPR